MFQNSVQRQGRGVTEYSQAGADSASQLPPVSPCDLAVRVSAECPDTELWVNSGLRRGGSEMTANG